MRKLTIRITGVLLCLLLLCGVFPASAEEDALPAPTWVQVSLNSDGSKNVTITTPTYMLDLIDFYEYSMDGGFTWQTLSDPTGGEFRIADSCEFVLRYKSGETTSESYRTTIEINKVTAVTSNSTGITLLIPRDSDTPTDVTLSAYEIINGKDYSAVQNTLGANKPFLLFHVTIMRNNKVYSSAAEKLWYFPTRELDVRYAKLYHVTNDGELIPVASEPEMNVLRVTTADTGLFAVVEDKTFSPGDVNGDAKVTASDARLALRLAAKLETLSANAQTAADVNGDGFVTPEDARFILRVAAGLEQI